MIKSDKCMGFSQLLGARVRAAPPKVYAYGGDAWVRDLDAEEGRRKA